MEDFTKEQKQYAYKRLSEAEKDFISSDEMIEAYQKIGTRNGLLLDAIGKMSNVVFLALLGLVRVSEIRSALQKTLGLPDAKTDALLNDLNQSIFVPFRDLLKNETGGSLEEGKEAAAPEKGALAEKTVEVNIAPEPTREDILAEIENPTPATHPISAASQITSGPMKPREVIPEPSKDPVSKDFVAGKLSETVSIPSAKATATPPKPNNYAADPYREPIA